MTTAAEAAASAKEELVEFVDRYERILQSITENKYDLKHLMEEIVGSGFDRKAFLHIIKLRAKGETSDEDLFNMIVETYKAALGMS